MKRLIDGLTIDNKRAIKSKPTTYHGLDSHKWATKMEIQRLRRGTGFQPVKTRPRWPCHPDLKINPPYVWRIKVAPKETD